MVSALVITLHEGLEAALVVGILLWISTRFTFARADWLQHTTRPAQVATYIGYWLIVLQAIRLCPQRVGAQFTREHVGKA